MDVNDNAPVFSTSHFSFDVYESAVRGAPIGRISATDKVRVAFSA